MSFLEELKELEKQTVCRTCRETYPEMDMSSRLCIHCKDSNNFPGFLWQMIFSQNEEIINDLVKSENHSVGKPFEIKIIVNGIAINSFSFFQRIHDDLEKLTNSMAQKKTQEVIDKFEEKFQSLLKEASKATKELFPGFNFEEKNE